MTTPMTQKPRRVRARPLALSAVGGLVLCGSLSGAPAARGGGGADDRPGLEHTVEMDDFRFVPARVVVRPGQLVVWKNSDRARHNAFALGQVNGRPAFMTRTGGRRALLTARARRWPGTYAYICTVHPGMRGVLVVRR
jgi:plastocyanin